HRLAARGVGDLLDHVLRLDDVVAPLVAERLLHLPLGDLRVPGLLALLALAAGLRLLADRPDERPQHAAAVAADRPVPLAALAGRRRTAAEPAGSRFRRAG